MVGAGCDIATSASAPSMDGTSAGTVADADAESDADAEPGGGKPMDSETGGTVDSAAVGTGGGNPGTVALAAGLKSG